MLDGIVGPRRRQAGHGHITPDDEHDVTPARQADISVGTPGPRRPFGPQRTAAAAEDDRTTSPMSLC
jgi:hypothetical protein